MDLEQTELLLFACGITWAGDTLAYFVGRAFGKHPLAPELSPKKTGKGRLGAWWGGLMRLDANGDANCSHAERERTYLRQLCDLECHTEMDPDW